MTIILPLLAAALLDAAPRVDAAEESVTLAERRLRACLSANASGGHSTIEAAVLSTRAACKPQIDAARDQRIIAATAGLDPAASQAVTQRVTRELNNEIAHAIANFSGLPLPYAPDR